MSEKTLAEELCEGKDWEDINTVQGCLTRASRIAAKGKSLADRFTLFPIQDEEAFEFFTLQEAALWTAKSLDYVKDKKDYDSLSPALKRVVDYVNSFFSASDNMVLENISYRFMAEAKTMEEKMFYAVQSYIESVHSEAYSIVINTLVSDQEERDKLFKSADNLACVRNKNKWMEIYMNSPLDLQYRRVVFAIVEGIFFISSFCFIFYFRSKGLLQNIVFLNEEIQKDEKCHLAAAVAFYKREKRISEEHIKKMFIEAVDLECKFVDEVLPEQVEDLTPSSVKDYVRFLADHLLVSLGHGKIWNIKIDQLSSWLGDLSMEQKTNFYEGRSGNYKQTNIKRALDWKGRISGKYEEDKKKAYEDPSSVNF